MTSQLNRNLEELETHQTSWFDRFFRDSEGRIVIAQMPNLPVMVGVVATILQFILPNGTTIQTVAELVAFGALFTWAWQELFQGVNYFRRSLGLVSLLGLIALGLNLANM